MKTFLMFLALAACHRNERSLPPNNPTAFCGSSCWNDSNCTASGGWACGKCISNQCSSRIPVAALPDEFLAADR